MELKGDINMSEEQTTTSVSGDEGIDTSQYISAINDIRNNSVSKEAYNKFKEENKQLLD